MAGSWGTRRSVWAAVQLPARGAGAVCSSRRCASPLLPAPPARSASSLPHVHPSLPSSPPPLLPQVYVSYGGLLMQLTGDPKRLEDLDIDQNIYLLMRKV